MSINAAMSSFELVEVLLTVTEELEKLLKLFNGTSVQEEVRQSITVITEMLIRLVGENRDELRSQTATRSIARIANRTGKRITRTLRVKKKRKVRPRKKRSMRGLKRLKKKLQRLSQR